ncbi:DUF4347 domain-containing protein [Tychonema sp. BBK16]|uniref:DUF4347 domain-containing protein n=1 Tax=Tychonema sp. BBK16 TaxID=2699888 RepID=UPI001F16CC22|nr:DUF4347 domain-containing protein [Tychonema sp. BBK16]MCF6374062.1 DUF4347 domain-containing protein [Tychonema sp. BBK16]
MSTLKVQNSQKNISNISWGGFCFTAEAKPKSDLVIVDSKVDNYQELVSGVKAGFEVIAIDQVGNAIEQITEILNGRNNINSIHIVSHGQEAALKLGRAELNIHNLETYSSQLQQWGKALSESGSILLYGCNIATGESGIKFIQKLSEIIGANIAASNNLTGNAALGGDWELEITTGLINVELAFEKAVLESYTSVLATLVTEDFKQTTVIGPWIYGVGGASAPPGLTAGALNNSGVLPNIGNNDPGGSGALRLTSNAKNQAAFIIYNNPIAATGGIRVTFDFFSYNISADSTQGVGADGTSFFLIDGTATPIQAGGFGGSLGYAPNNNPDPALFSTGLAGGYLGVGLDEFGNFSTAQLADLTLTPPRPIPGRIGGVVRTPDSVAVRGSQSRSYDFLTNAVVPGGIDNLPGNINTTIRSDAKRSVQITLFPATSPTPNRLSVAFNLNGNTTFDAGETLIDIPNLATTNAAVPSTFKFGFAAATGQSTNIHEINNVLVETIDPPTLVADVSIVKKGPQFAKPSSAITYTITSTNNGPNTAENVLIQDPLPAGLTFVSADNLGTFNPTTRTVIWPVIPTLANGASVIRTITATVPATLGTALINTAYSSSSTFDPNLTNNNSSQPTSQVPTTITNLPLADVITTKSGAATAAAGARVSYTITTQNNGPDTADNVTITDSIIPGLTGVSLSDSGTYNATTGIVTFPAINLANTVSTPRSISFIAPANLSVSNTARSTSSTLDPTPGNNDGTAPGAVVTTNLTPSADVITTKSGITNAAAGATVGYTITTRNIGPSTAENVTITDSIIPGLTGVSVSDSGTYNATTGIVTFPPINLANTVSTPRSISFIAPANLSVSNTARSTSSTLDPTPGNNDGTAVDAVVTTNLTPSADVITTKSGITNAVAGAIVGYTITTRNIGPSTAENITITDSIIPGLTGVVVSEGGTYNATTGIVTFPPINLANTVSTTRSISFIAPASGSISNTARSTSSTADPTPGNNDGTAAGAVVTTILGPSADVITTKSGITNAVAGAIVGYTITTRNIGPSTAENVTITDSIIPGLTGVSVSDSGTYNATTGIVTFPPINLANTVSTTRSISFIAPASGSISNTARSTASTADPTPGNNDGTAAGAVVTTILGPSADVITTKSGITNAAPGAIVSYTISTRNIGPSTAENVTITDSIIPGLTGVVLSEGGTYNATTGIVTFLPINLANTVSTTRSISFIAPNSGSITNTARSTSSTADPTPGNNDGSAPGAVVTTTLTPIPIPPIPIPTPNKPPVTANAQASIPPNSSTRVTGLGATDSDGSIASFTINTLPPTAQGVLFLGDPANGGIAVTPGQVLTPAQIGQLFFRTTGEFTGANFTYSATDNQGASSSATATLGATPTPTPIPIPNNQPPVATNANLTIPPNSSTRVAGLGGTDPDGSIASFTINTLPPTAQGVLFLGDPANGGIAVTPGQVLTPAQIGQLFFRTTGEFTGANFTYSATDNNGATSPATATVAALPPTPNQPPVATNANLSIPPNSSTRVTGLGGTDPDGSIASFTINTLPPAGQGVLFLGDPANGGIAVTPGQVLTPEQIGQLFFRTTGEFTGANFTYSATDNQGATSPATATVATIPSPTPNPTPNPTPTPTPNPTPNPNNQPPVSTNVNFSIPPNSSRLVTGLGGTDPDGSIASFTINTLPPAAQGVLFLGDPANGGIAVTPGQVLTPAQIQQLFFRTTGEFTGTDFTYSATDNNGTISPATATVAALLPTPNQPPVAANTNFGTSPNNSTPVTGLSATDPDGTIASFTINTLPPADQGTLFLGDPANGGVPITVGQTLTPEQVQQLFFRATGQFTGGTFTYSATDNSGTISPGRATVAAILRPTVLTPTPGIGTDIDCGCEVVVEKPEITFLPPAQPPRISFDQPGVQITVEEQTLKGINSNDFIQGQNEAEKIIGFQGNDSLLGEGGSDEIYGNEGNDIIFGGLGSDVVYGGDNNDLVLGGKGNDWISGELGSDTILGDRGADTILGDTGQNNSQNPNDARDLIFGGESADVINGNEGDDTIHGGKGNDIAIGGKNKDLILGEQGSDTLIGGSGDDSLFGGNRDNRARDSQGRDLLYGGDGNDLLNGQENDDTLISGKGNDVVYGGKGNDLLFGQLGSDTLYGNEGIDTILGDSGSSNSVGDTGQQDLIFGGTGGDIIGGGNGDDTVYAGKGNDYVWGGKNNDLIWGELGNDTLTGDSGDDTLYGGVRGLVKDTNGKDLLFGNIGSDLLFGDESDDTISGGKSNDSLFGGKGNDFIHGDDDDDLIYGGDGSDELCGDEGNDTIYGDRADDKGVSVGSTDQLDCINGGDGNDLIYGNEGEDTLNGDAGNDTLYGGKDNDILFGGEGDDILFGSSGDNTLSGGVGSDQFILGANGLNTILNFEAGIDKLVLTGGLTFQQLQFTSTQNGSLLRVAGTGQVLANLVGGIGAFSASDVRSNLLPQ